MKKVGCNTFAVCNSISINTKHLIDYTVIGSLWCTLTVMFNYIERSKEFSNVAELHVNFDCQNNKGYAS